MNIHPEIAESYTQVSPTVYEFKIRQGIRFHDGSEMTVEDVKFSLDRRGSGGTVILPAGAAEFPSKRPEPG